MRVQIPQNWAPRPYQLPLWDYMANGGKRAVIRWHRRGGKDDVSLHITCRQALMRIGNYWYMLPEKEHARLAIWNAINPHTGKRRIDEAFPPEIRRRMNDQQMLIELINGATFQIVGSDNFNSLVGSPPIGLVFSEYALANPSAWDYLRPMLLENGGWVIFNSTVRGTNHFWQLGELAQSEDKWFFQQIDANQSGVFTTEQLESEKREMCKLHGEDEGLAIFRQEYFNDPNASIPGAYYGRLMMNASDEGRITSLPYEPTSPVITAWDIGINDDNVIWFFQIIGRELHAIDYYSANNQGMPHYVQIILNKPYTYFEHLLPHDAVQREKGTGKSLNDTLRDLGLHRTKVIPRTPTIQKQIDDVRNLLPKVWFDKARCSIGIDCLKSYHRDWDDTKKCYKDSPVHDWASHGASAFATFAQAMAAGYKVTDRGVVRQRFADSDYNMLD